MNDGPCYRPHALDADTKDCHPPAYPTGGNAATAHAPTAPPLSCCAPPATSAMMKPAFFDTAVQGAIRCATARWLPIPPGER
jgi:hypothetical protein